MSIVTKSSPLQFRRLAKEYRRLYRSEKMMKSRLTDTKIRYIVSQRKDHKSTADIALELGVSSRRVRQIYAEFVRTDNYHVQRKPGRRTHPITIPEIQAVLTHCLEQPGEGVGSTTRNLKRKSIKPENSISYYEGDETSQTI